MSRIAIFHENASTHEEEYLTCAGKLGEFVSVKNPALSNLEFETAAEAYEFASYFPRLSNWRVGVR